MTTILNNLKDIVDVPIFLGHNRDLWDLVKDAEIKFGVSTWSSDPDDQDPLWPCEDVAITSLPERCHYLISGVYVVGVQIIQIDLPEGGRDIAHKVDIYLRKSSEQYWPTAQKCEALLLEWVDRLWERLTSEAENHKYSPNIQWSEDRRYGTKGNSLHTMVKVLGIDPEGRYGLSHDREIPEHVVRYIHLADYRVGLRSGEQYIKADDLYSSGSSLDTEDALSWCKNHGS